MAITYGWEKLLRAVYGMAESPASIQQRVGDAYTYNIIHIRPEHDLPPDSRALFKEIKERLTAVEAKSDEGRIQATINEMSVDDATDIARKIVRLYDEVCVAVGDD